MEILKQSKTALERAIEIINSGGVVICPTDTVYGFLADAQNKKAVEKIFKIKKRPKLKPLPIFVKDLTMAKTMAVVDERAKKFLLTPKVTTVLKMRSKAKLYGMAKDHSIALRIPRNQFLIKLLSQVKKPLSQTSVNVSGQKSLNTIDDIMKTFGKNKLVGLIINGGNLKKAKPSKILDFTSKHLTRLR